MKKVHENRQPSLSEREINKRYHKMMSGLLENCAENRINVYSCSCGNRIKTIDVDKGVTPFMISCLCGNMAKSSFYNDIAPDVKIKLEWYRPSLKECLKLKNKPNELDHIFQGGLIYREIKK